MNCCGNTWLCCYAATLPGLRTAMLLHCRIDDLSRCCVDALLRCLITGCYAVMLTCCYDSRRVPAGLREGVKQVAQVAPAVALLNGPIS
jgi:hypothetical protein